MPVNIKDKSKADIEFQLYLEGEGGVPEHIRVPIVAGTLQLHHMRVMLTDFAVAIANLCMLEVFLQYTPA